MGHTRKNSRPFQFHGMASRPSSSHTAFSFRSMLSEKQMASPTTGGTEPVDESGSEIPVNWSDNSDSVSGDTDDFQYSLSSTRNYVIEDGRRFHAYHDGQYSFPNDEPEQSRDDLFHSMTVLLCDDKCHMAPVEQMLKNGARALDLCTGTGVWAIQMGDTYPEARIEGWDLSPIQPRSVPPNVRFELEDVEDDWIGPENHYDYIHIRHSMHSIKNRTKLINQIYKYLKPGGYIEFQDVEFHPCSDDDTLTDNTPYGLRDFFRHLEQGMRQNGSEVNGILGVPQLMEEAGFQEVSWTSRKAPVGEWPLNERLRTCGVLCREALLKGLVGMTLRPLGQRGLGWSREQIEVFLAGVRRDLQNPNFHAYFPLHIIYGQKPLA